MSDVRVDFSSADLLTTEPNLEPLLANGLRCHGGFDQTGAYRSPRTLHRMPAIRAWQSALQRDGHPLLGIDPALIPPQYPNLAQAKLLLKSGVQEPLVRVLTLISIAEGFGAMVREVGIPNLASTFVEPVQGTALAHLSGGLLEAHARDEAGHKDEGGHKQMWEAARDLALDKPRIPGDILMRMMGRKSAQNKERERLCPEIDPGLESMLTTLANVLVIEVFAARTFDWGEKLLSDPEVSAAPEAAGKMVSYIRADEEPHVEYLRTVLSEVSARTLKTSDGRALSGRIIVDRILHRTLSFIISQRPKEQRETVRTPLHEAILRAGKGPSIAEEFDGLESTWVAPLTTGFEASPV